MTSRGVRTFCFVNNRVGWQIVKWLKGRGTDIVGLAIHPKHRLLYGDETLEAAALDPRAVFDGSLLQTESVRDAILALRPDVGVSVYFGYVIKPDLFERFPLGCVNLHAAALPFNRGMHPNVWSIVDRTPAGVTLHYIDREIDRGDIIAQQMVPVEPHDTGETLYRKLEAAAVDLFQTTWPQVEGGTAPRICQPEGGSYHRRTDVDLIDHIDLDRTYTARALIDIIRARTFPPHRGAYFSTGGRKVYLRLQLTPEE